MTAPGERKESQSNSGSLKHWHELSFKSDIYTLVIQWQLLGKEKIDINSTDYIKETGNMKTAPGERKKKMRLIYYNRSRGEKREILTRLFVYVQDIKVRPTSA